MISLIKDFMKNNPKISNQKIEKVSQKILTLTEKFWEINKQIGLLNN